MSDFELPKDATTVSGRGKKIISKESPTPSIPPAFTGEIAETKAEIPAETKPKYDAEELISIFDEILFNNTYSEKVTIRNKLHVAFRTRTAEEVEAITRALDATSANLIATIEEKRSIMNLYYALTSYQGKDLGLLKQEDRERFVNKLPAPVVGALVIALSKFDEKVYLACKEGELNF